MPLNDILANFSPFFGHIASYAPIKSAKNYLKISFQIHINQFLEIL